MVASLTPLPVIGVPVRATRLDGVDSLLSIVQVHFHCIIINFSYWFFAPFENYLGLRFLNLSIYSFLLPKMPRGVPVATVAINNATNAALLAVRMLGISDNDLVSRFSFLSFLLLHRVR